MRTLFDATNFNGLSLKNRFVRSATWEAMADENGAVTDRLIELYTKLAEGQVGLIITSWAFILPDGKGLPNMLGIDNDSVIDGYKRLTRQMHKKGSKIILQIGYGGTQSYLDVPNVYSPSAIPDKSSGKVGKEMSLEDIYLLKKAFVAAAIRAKNAGFDGVQLHAAHGFLLSQFLSPYYNSRRDEYGGPIENRARLLFEIYEEIRKAVGKNFMVMAKINCADFFDEGLIFKDSIYVCKQLALMGSDALEISGGVAAGRESIARVSILSAAQEAYFASYAAEIAASINIPVILVGGLRSLEVIERLLHETNISYFSMARPFMSEPDLVKRWQESKQEKAKCVSCNKCITASGNYCTVFAEHSI